MLVLLSKQLVGCYDSANVQYNENLKTADVYLHSSDNPLCNNLQNEVQVVISFHNEYLPILYIQGNFNYDNFSQFSMKNVSISNEDPLIIDMPKYAYLNISNIAFWTTVRISEISKQSSQMDQCFEQQGSSFSMARGQFSMTLNLTTACFNEIVENSKQFQYSFNNRAGTVNIILQRNDPVNYNCWVGEIDGYNYINCLNEGNFLADVQQSFISPLFQFFVQVGDRTFTTEIRVVDVLVGRVENFFDSIMAQFYKDSFYINYVNTKDPSLMQDWIEAIEGATRIIYRLSVKTPDQDLAYEFIQETFKITQNYLIFQCFGEQSCLEQLSFISQNSENFRFQLDCFAFINDSLTASVGQEFTTRLSCFQRTVMQIFSSKKVCFQLQKSPFFDSAAHCKLINEGEEAQVTAQSFLTENDYMVDFSMQETLKFYFDDPVFCFVCEKCVDQIINMRDKNTIVILTGVYPEVQFTALGQQTQEMGYGVVQIVVGVVGVGFIVYFVCDSISKLMMFMKLAKMYKQKK